MTVSRKTCWLLMLAAASLCLCAYVGTVFAFDLGSAWRFLGVTQARAFLPAAILFALLGDALKLLWVCVYETAAPVVTANASENTVGSAEVAQEGEAADEEASAPAQAIQAATPAEGTDSGTHGELPGEALFNKVRDMAHQEIPDFETDGVYLVMLGDSAEAGYGPAMKLLGEYAMRRGTLVESYYWTWRAQRVGVRGLGPELNEMRKAWIAAGSPDEEENVYELFSQEAGSIGRALLNRDTGRDAVAAREYLRANYPEFA